MTALPLQSQRRYTLADYLIRSLQIELRLSEVYADVSFPQRSNPIALEEPEHP